jgi:hypothetical protein
MYAPMFSVALDRQRESQLLDHMICGSSVLHRAHAKCLSLNWVGTQRYRTADDPQRVVDWWWIQPGVCISSSASSSYKSIKSTHTQADSDSETAGQPYVVVPNMRS